MIKYLFIKLSIFTPFLILGLFLSPPAINAATYDMETTSNWNVRWDGESAGDYLTHVGLYLADLDNNGKKDLIIGALNTDNNSRSNSGSVYIIYNELLQFSGTGNTLDLADSSNWNIRFDGAVATGLLGDGLLAGDINNDNKNDLILSAPYADYNSRNNSGSLYVIYNSSFQTYSGTGNVVDLADSSNWNIRFDGGLSSEFLGVRSHAVDLNDNSKNDLLVSASGAGYNSRSSSGSSYIIYDSLIDDYSGTGNIIDLADSGTFNIRIDGASAGDGLSNGSLTYGDLGGSGNTDIMVGAYNADNNGRSNSGSAYILYDNAISSYTGTDNTIDLADDSNWNVRIDGANSGDLLSLGSLAVSDINGVQGDDVVVSALTADYNSRGSSGSVYVIYESLISDYTGTGNTHDLANGSSYNIRLDGESTSDLFGYVRSAALQDIDNDNYNDLLITARRTDHNSRSDSGSLYVVYNSYLQTFSDTGNTVDMLNNQDFGVRYDGAGAGDWLSYLHSHIAGDVNSDGSKDLFVGANTADNNGRSDSGSLYLVYNFPHSVSIDSTPSIQAEDSFNITGSITASDSVTNISKVQYSVDTSTWSGTWTDCTADDGSFNSTSEEYTCSLSSLSDGSHTVRIRALDENTSYTASSNYGRADLTMDSTGPVKFDVRSIDREVFDNTGDDKVNSIPNKGITNDSEVALAWHNNSDATTAIEKFKVFLGRIGEGLEKIATLNGTVDYYVTNLDEEGVFEWYIEAEDTAGNKTTTDTYQFEIDTTSSSIHTVETINGNSVQGGSVTVPQGDTLKVEGQAEEDVEIIVDIYDPQGETKYQDIICGTHKSLGGNVGKYICEEKANIHTNYLLKVYTRDEAENLSPVEEIDLIVN